MAATATTIPFRAKAPKKALVEAAASKSRLKVSESDLGGGDERFHNKKVGHGVHLGLCALWVGGWARWGTVDWGYYELLVN